MILPDRVIKLLEKLYNAAEKGSMIPCALLQGLPGAGKTSTAEAFSLAVEAQKFFYQCNPGTGFDQLIGQPNLGAVLRQDAAACIADGILIQAARAAVAGNDVVLILDEIDKASPEVDAYLLDFLQSRRIHDSNMEELVVPSDVKFWVFLTSNAERDLSDALMRRVRRINIDRPSRSTVASVLGIKEDAALLDVWDFTEKLAISQLRSYLEDGGDPQDLDLDILSQYVDDLPDLSTLAEQKAELSVDPEITVVPATVMITDWANKIDDELFHQLAQFSWKPRDRNSIEVSVPTLSILTHLISISELQVRICSSTESGVEQRMIIDLINPVISNRYGGIFTIPVPGKEEVITIVARRDTAGNYYLNGDDLYRLPEEEFFNALQGLAKDLQRMEFREKHSQQLQEARNEASEGQAQSLLKRLGLDDLL